MARLTEKQKRFVEEYLVDLNATQAAIRAGYAEKTADVQGPRLLGNVRVQEEIQAAMAERAKRTEITQDMVLRELAKVAFSNGTDFARVVSTPAVTTIVDEEGNPQQVTRPVQRVELVDTDQLSPDKRAAIAGIKEGKFGIEVKGYDKIKALELLGQHLGLFTGKEAQRDESGDDGFLDALRGEAAEVWQE